MHVLDMGQSPPCIEMQDSKACVNALGIPSLGRIRIGLDGAARIQRSTVYAESDILAPFNTAPRASHAQTVTPARTSAHDIAIYLGITNLRGQRMRALLLLAVARVSHGQIEMKSGRPID